MKQNQHKHPLTLLFGGKECREGVLTQNQRILDPGEARGHSFQTPHITGEETG